MPLTASSMSSYWSPYDTPQVRWTGTSNKGAEVLDWHRKVLANGTRPSVQVDGGAVLLGLVLARQAKVRPAPPQRLYQAFIAEDAQVVQIRGDPDQGQCARPRRKGSVPVRHRTELS